MSKKKYVNEEPITVDINDIIAEDRNDYSSKSMPSNHDNTVKPANASKSGKVFNCQSLNVRDNPTSNSNIVKVIDRGTSVKVVDENDDFYSVICEDGTKGYCMKQFVEVK